MQQIFPKFGRSILLEAALGILVLHAPISCAEELLVEDTEIGLLSAPPSKGGKPLQTLPEIQDSHNTPSLPQEEKVLDSYTINFNNISIIEYIRFVSKITKLNFTFDETELDFNVSIVSEDPVSSRNILSILIQILRIHDLVVLEQDQNILITKSRSVNQIATLVAPDLPSSAFKSAPVVTRVFRIKNANPETISSIIKPMLSATALLEVSKETRQLIITDITTNVDKISSLLASIDAPHSSVEIDSYTVQHGNIDDLIKTATLITTPLADGNPLIFVPHPITHTIFIISTPYLIERSLTVFEDLDVPYEKPGQEQQIFLYKLKYLSGEMFLNALDQLAEQLRVQKASTELVEALEKADWIKESNSILFHADPLTLQKIQQLLPALDYNKGKAAANSQSGLFVYKLEHTSFEQFQESLHQIKNNLEKGSVPDKQLISVIDSMAYNPDIHSVVFTGDKTALKRLERLIPAVDITSAVSKTHTPDQFFIYHPKTRSGKELEEQLKEISHNLEISQLADPAFLHAIQSMKWVPLTNSLIFTGNAASLKRIEETLSSLDNSAHIQAVQAGGNSHTFILYKLKYASGDTVIEYLKKVGLNLQDSGVPDAALIHTIDEAKWIKDDNSLLLTGSTASLDHVKKLIEHFDVPTAVSKSSTITPSDASNTTSSTSNLVGPNKSSFYMYRPVHQTPDNLALAIQDLAKDLQDSGLMDVGLIEALQTMKTVEANKTLLFTGSPETLEKVRTLIVPLDTASPETGHIQQLGEHAFFIYKIQHLDGNQLLNALKNLALDLQRSGAIDPNLILTLNEAKLVKETNSILFTGTPASLKSAEAMVKKFDNSGKPDQPEGAAPASVPSNFVVYTPRNLAGPDLIKILAEFKENLVSSGISDPNLFETINNLKWIPTTRSLLISGNEASIEKVEGLLQRFDIPSPDIARPIPTIEAIDNTSFLIYKLQNHQGEEILSALKQITLDISGNSSTSNQNLVSAINSLQWIRVTNSLLASGEPSTLAKLKDLIQNLDIPLRQVFIEILVIETTVLNTHNFGLQWGGRMQYLNRFAAGSGSFPQPAGTAPSTNGLNIANGIASTSTSGLNAVNATTTPTSTQSNIPFMTGFDLGVIGDIIMHKGKSFISLGSLVNALQTDTDSTVVMNPKVITQDNKNSTIFIGNNIPFAGSSTTITGAAGQQSTNLEYRDIGFNLSITPTIGNNDLITLDINNDISEVLQVNIPNTSQGSSGGLNGIQTSHTSMVTRVHVPDQHFVVLTGMIQDSKSRYRSAIPCLGGLPVIGAAFEENDRLNARQNIIIFVRPYIVDTYEDYKTLTNQQETLFKEQAGLPVLKEEFDAGLDLVKQPNNE